MLRLATDCTGIDAPLHALLNVFARNGWSTENIEYVFASEIDPTLRALLQQGQSGLRPTRVFGDITSRENAEITENIDLYVAGFPCQSFSQLGNELGLDDERGRVALSILNFLNTCQPRIFVLENVSNIVSHNGGSTFRFILATLEQHFHTTHDVISPTDIGFPQSRKRVFIIGIHKTKCTSEQHGQIPRLWSGLERRQFPCLESLMLHPEEARALEPRVYRPLTPFMQKALDAQRAKAKLRGEDLFTEPYIVNVGNSSNFHRLHKDKGTSICITTNSQYFFYTLQQRYITYREKLRIQGFRDDFLSDEDLMHVPMTKRHSAAGNTMCVPVVEHVIEPLIDMLLQTDSVGC